MIEKPSVYSRRLQKALRINEAESLLLHERLNRLEDERRLLALRNESHQQSLQRTLRSIRQSTGTLNHQAPDAQNHATVTFYMYGAPVARCNRHLRYPYHGARLCKPGMIVPSGFTSQPSAGPTGLRPCHRFSSSVQDIDTKARGSCSCRCLPLRLPALPRVEQGFSMYFSEMSAASSVSPTPSSDLKKACGNARKGKR